MSQTGISFTPVSVVTPVSICKRKDKLIVIVTFKVDIYYLK
jgi:hypothetical protein